LFQPEVIGGIVGLIALSLLPVIAKALKPKSQPGAAQ